MRMVKDPNWPVDRFADLLGHIHAATGLNQSQLAGLAGMNPSAVNRWLSGKSKPRAESLILLGQALRDRFPDLGIGPDDLIASVYGTPDATDETTPTADAEQRQPSDVHDTEASPAAGRVSTVEEAIAAAMAQINAVAAANHEELLQALAEQREQIEQQNEKIDRQNAKIIELSRKLDADEDQDGGERKAI